MRARLILAALLIAVVAGGAAASGGGDTTLIRAEVMQICLSEGVPEKVCGCLGDQLIAGGLDEQAEMAALRSRLREAMLAGQVFPADVMAVAQSCVARDTAPL